MCLISRTLYFKDHRLIWYITAVMAEGKRRRSNDDGFYQRHNLCTHGARIITKALVRWVVGNMASYDSVTIINNEFVIVNNFTSTIFQWELCAWFFALLKTNCISSLSECPLNFGNVNVYGNTETWFQSLQVIQVIQVMENHNMQKNAINHIDCSKFTRTECS